MSNTPEKNADRPASPLGDACLSSAHVNSAVSGLTKREAFAMASLQGLLVNAGRNRLELSDCAAEAVRQADLLLFELEKKE